MLKRICVAYGDGDLAATTLTVASDLARRTRARVTLVRVAAFAYEDPLTGAEETAFDLLAVTDDRRWRARLNGIATRMAPELDVEVRVVVGAPAEQLPMLAAEVGADLVVAGAPRAGGARGGVARELLRRGPCPVMFVREHPARPGTVVLACASGSTWRDRRALAAARRLAAALAVPVAHDGAGVRAAGGSGRAAGAPLAPVAAVIAAPRRPRLRELLDGGPASALVDRARCPVVVVGRGVHGAWVDDALDVPAHRAASWFAMRLRPSLLVRIFAVNALVLVVATLVLIVTPLSISSSIVLNEVIVAAAGLTAMLVADFVLLRRALGPLRSVTELIATIEPRSPGRRLPGDAARGAEVEALASAFNAMLDRLERERRQSARRALGAQEDERERIARELHDEVGQTLTAITIQAERAAQAEGPIDRELVDGIARTALLGVEDVRRIARELRPEALDDLGLVNALIALTTRMGAQSGVRIERDLSGALPPLAPEVELVIYRVAQESITNAIRHAEPTTVSVALAAAPDGVTLRVRDDGRGISPAALDGDTGGLSGMRERALLVGGALRLRLHPGGGTEVELWIPLAETAAP